VPDWNKDVSFGRKKRQTEQPAEPKQSIWKKELGKPKAPKAAKPEGATDAVPFWKKEVGKPKAPKAAKAAKPEKAPKAAKPQGDVPFWKKELGRKKQPAAPVAAPAEAVAPEPAPLAASAPAEAEDFSWLTSTLEAHAPAPAPAAPPAEWPSRAEAPSAPSAPSAPPAPSAAAWPPPSEGPTTAAWPPPSEPAAAAPAAEPVAVAPAAAPVLAPQPEAGLDVPAAAQQVPFWKKELGKPKAPKAPKAEQAAKPKSDVPFWKRELGKPKPAAEQVAAVELEPKVPFWKKELGKPKGPKAERPAKADKAAADVPFWKRQLGKPKGEQPAKAEQPKSSVPFWKRELGKPKGAQTATAEKVKSDVPFWKRELGGSNGGKAKATAARASKSSPAKAAQKKEGTIIGLKIGASQIAAARVSNNGAPQLLQVARDPLEDGIVVGGELRDVEALSEALKKFFVKHKLPKKGIRLGIANNRIGVRTFEITGIEDPRQLANAIRFRAQETLPIPLEEAVLDWQVLREETDENGVTTRRVLLVVAYRELVDRYVSACKRAGLRLEGIDLEAFAMLRSLTVPTGDDDAPPGAQVVVNVGHDRSTFAVTDGRVCEFTRVVAWGGQNLNVAIARALDLTPSESAPIKHALSLVDDSVLIDNFPPERAAATCAAARSELQAFARELVSSLRFYQNQPGSLGISELVLSGGTAELPGLADELQRLIGVVVRVGDPTVRLKVGKKVSEDAVGSFAVAIGLGIED
jgi:type IV pilus assembly protein PilM